MLAGWVKNKQETKFWCDTCIEHHELKSKKLKKVIDPPCEQCFPGILNDNSDAWQVFQLGSFDPWGISPITVIELCRVLKIEDVEECLYKMSKIVQVMNEEKFKTPPAPKGLSNAR